MNLAEPRGRRIALVAIAALSAATLVLDPPVTWWAASALAVVVGWSLTVTWYETRGPGAVVLGLVGRWLELPGAERAGRTSVRVYDGTQPLLVRLGRSGGELAAVVETPALESTTALRVWPREASAPLLGQPVERIALMEARFAGQLKVEASSAQDAARALDDKAATALAGVRKEAGDAWRGLTYDGRTVAVFLAGPVVTDPERATQLARALWRRFVA